MCVNEVSLYDRLKGKQEMVEGLSEREEREERKGMHCV